MAKRDSYMYVVRELTKAGRLHRGRHRSWVCPNDNISIDAWLASRRQTRTDRSRAKLAEGLPRDCNGRVCPPAELDSPLTACGLRLPGGSLAQTDRHLENHVEIDYAREKRLGSQ